MYQHSRRLRIGRKIVSRILYKGRQIFSFYRQARTPFALALDTLKIKWSPFVAISGDGLKLSLLPRSGESFTFYENLIQRCYFKKGITLEPGSIVVDIGANIGTFTVLAASIVGPRGHVIAFEPVTKTFERLKRNVVLNGLGNVNCQNAAIYSREGTITLQVCKKSALAKTQKPNDRGADYLKETASCLTLDRVFKDFKIDRINLLKVDCEGSEHGIFETLSPGAAARIDQISMEVHAFEGTSIDRLGERLATLGFFTVRYGSIWVAFNTQSQEIRGDGSAFQKAPYVTDATALMQRAMRSFVSS
jgi:FkbM family methyltransferase